MPFPTGSTGATIGERENSAPRSTTDSPFMRAALFCAAATALSFAVVPAHSQNSYTLRPNHPMTGITPSKCLASVRVYPTDSHWTDGTCSRVELSESSTSINIHFITGNVRVIYIIPAEAKGNRIMPVVGIGAGRSGQLGVGDAETGQCEYLGNGIKCRALVNRGHQRFGFVHAASF